MKWLILFMFAGVASAAHGQTYKTSVTDLLAKYADNQVAAEAEIGDKPVEFNVVIDGVSNGWLGAVDLDFVGGMAIIRDENAIKTAMKLHRNQTVLLRCSKIHYGAEHIFGTSCVILGVANIS